MEKSKAKVIERFIATAFFFVGFSIMLYENVAIASGMMLFAVGVNSMLRLYLEKMFNIHPENGKIKEI